MEEAAVTSYKDPKTRLQELVQAEGKSSPQYTVIKTSGPDHNKIFKVAVIIEGKKTGEGFGRSKQEAEQDAAKLALERSHKI